MKTLSSHFLLVVFAVIVFSVSDASGQCLKQLRGTSSKKVKLLCEIDSSGDTTVVTQDVDDETTKAVSHGGIVKLLNRDKKLLQNTNRSLKKAKRELRRSKEAVNPKAAKALEKANDNLQKFDIPTQIAQDTQFENMEVEQAKAIERGLRQETRKTLKENETVRRDTRTKVSEFSKGSKLKRAVKKICKPRNLKSESDQCDFELSCSDGADDDSDGFTDCDDRDCLGKKECPECGEFVIPAELVIFSIYNETDVTKCSTVALVQWSDEDDEGAASWKLHITAGGRDESYDISPPFTDTFSRQGIEFSAPEGAHWNMLGVGASKDGAGTTNPVSCSDFEDWRRNHFSNPYLTVSICK